jgi:hypothetical protein
MHTCSKVNSFRIRQCNITVAGYTVTQLPTILSEIFSVFLTSHYVNWRVQIYHHRLISNSLPCTISTPSCGTLLS